MLSFSNLNIRAKLSIVISIIVVSMSLVMSIIFILKSNNEMMSSIVVRSGMLARSMAVLSANYIAGFQYLDVQKAIEDVVDKDKEIVYGYLEDVNGDVISPVFRDELIKDQSKILSDYKNFTKILGKLDPYGYGFTADVRLNIVVHGNERCVDVRVPVVIGESVSSYIRFGTTLRYLDQQLLMNIIISVLIVTFLIGIGIVFSWSFARSFSTPILKLKDAAIQFGNKNFDYSVEIVTNDEIGVLAKTFDEMRKNIKQYSEHLEELVAQRTKELQEAYQKLKEKDDIIQMELDFASKIQKGIMPNGGYKWHDFVVFGYSQPMEKIGGDFFDIFPIPGGKLLFYVADVSGHGIPAALVTTMLKISLINISFETSNPSEIIERLNERIRIINSDASQVMANYLTIFTSIVDREGNMVYSSGGHHKPILYNSKTRTFEELPEAQGAIVGIIQPELYSCTSSNFVLKDGDKMILYTDGVTERRNLSNKELELEGLKKIVAECVDRNLSGKKLLAQILSEIDRFAEGVPPRDDFTILLVEKIKSS
ncbi:MAG: SpoIIE family protein phosphatase [Spirochaetia bacterium]|nr:SpoIIE family protein phosphatase [Spirochaetota bacterium]MDW8112186.1 SpoIIE family protein phosphatase [Spirochaetia bacterium]